jgi:hypothetical protein
MISPRTKTESTSIGGTHHCGSCDICDRTDASERPIGSGLCVRSLGRENIRMLRRVTSATVALVILRGPGLTQGQRGDPPAPGAAEPKPDRAAEIARYQYWCGRTLTLASCVYEIIELDKVLLERKKEFQKTGREYYAGNSLIGCHTYCILLYFPHDTASECKASIATFEKVAMRKPYLWRTDLRQLLLERCKLAFQSPDAA